MRHQDLSVKTDLILHPDTEDFEGCSRSMFCWGDVIVDAMTTSAELVSSRIRDLNSSQLPSPFSQYFSSSTDLPNRHSLFACLTVHGLPVLVVSLWLEDSAAVTSPHSVSLPFCLFDPEDASPEGVCALPSLCSVLSRQHQLQQNISLANSSSSRFANPWTPTSSSSLRLYLAFMASLH